MIGKNMKLERTICEIDAWAETVAAQTHIDQTDIDAQRSQLLTRAREMIVTDEPLFHWSTDSGVVKRDVDRMRKAIQDNVYITDDTRKRMLRILELEHIHYMCTRPVVTNE